MVSVLFTKFKYMRFEKSNLGKVCVDHLWDEGVKYGCID